MADQPVGHDRRVRAEHDLGADERLDLRRQASEAGVAGAAGDRSGGAARAVGGGTTAAGLERGGLRQIVMVVEDVSSRGDLHGAEVLAGDGGDQVELRVGAGDNAEAAAARAVAEHHQAQAARAQAEDVEQIVGDGDGGQDAGLVEQAHFQAEVEEGGPRSRFDRDRGGLGVAGQAADARLSNGSNSTAAQGGDGNEQRGDGAQDRPGRSSHRSIRTCDRWLSQGLREPRLSQGRPSPRPSPAADRGRG